MSEGRFTPKQPPAPMLLASDEAEVSGPPVVLIQSKDALPKLHPSPRHTGTPAKNQETKGGGLVNGERRREGGRGRGEKEGDREGETDRWLDLSASGAHKEGTTSAASPL